nr:GGDEF domain-containing protein [Pseudoalteromonas aurantia]
MTQLFNRRGMLAKLEYFQSIKKPDSVIALDIDHLKRINDKFGHDVGDQVIRTLAELMQSSAREQDVICRTG